MQRLFRSYRLVPSVFKQIRHSSYLHNGLKWGEDYPSIERITKKDFSATDLLADVKIRKPKLAHEVEIPYSFKGTKSFRPIKRAYDKALLDEKKTNLPYVHAKLEKYCAQYLKALSTQNILDLPPCESNFHVAVQKGFQLLKNGDFKLELRECSHELKEKGLKESVEIFETMHIMGLNVERALNGAIEDYTMNNLEEGKGLIIYMPKIDSDDEGDAAAKATHKDDPNHPVLRGFRRNIPELQVILRVYALYTTKYKLVPVQSGQEAALENYSFQHVAIFENQLRMPPPGGLAYATVEEGIQRYRLQEWKLVDFDGGIKGNPLLVEKAQQAKLHLLKQNK